MNKSIFTKFYFHLYLARARARARVDRASAATRAAGAARPLTPVVKGEAGGCRRRAHLGKSNFFCRYIFIFFLKCSLPVLVSIKIAEFFSIFRTAIKKRSHSSAFGCPLGKSLEFLVIFHDFEVPEN